MRLGARAAVIAACAGLVIGHATPAFAPHLFPLAPGDPTGDCAAKMKKAPAKSAAAHVTSEGFFFFDSASRTSTTTITVGQSVTWEFLRFCHSVTSVAVPKGAKQFKTYGGKGSAKGPVAGQDDLEKPAGDNNTYTVRFTKPGTYSYQCVHHASLGMKGTVVVSALKY
jgi:plastocyanin